MPRVADDDLSRDASSAPRPRADELELAWRSVLRSALAETDDGACDARGFSAVGSHTRQAARRSSRTRVLGTPVADLDELVARAARRRSRLSWIAAATVGSVGLSAGCLGLAPTSAQAFNSDEMHNEDVVPASAPAPAVSVPRGGHDPTVRTPPPPPSSRPAPPPSPTTRPAKPPPAPPVPSVPRAHHDPTITSPPEKPVAPPASTGAQAAQAAEPAPSDPAQTPAAPADPGATQQAVQRTSPEPAATYAADAESPAPRRPRLRLTSVTACITRIAVGMSRLVRCRARSRRRGSGWFAGL